ncbi:hypothetical protein BOTBODRAFT_51904 [Botryobasidium botryosum FD-172 SS1]|uniref:Uncharacterized protein n=1 Tax=Botryobasidium botryosum (strain FD-172 SS1) TaxID=930990 RepID=A0A067MXU0_BOTB1|nr:hypothetical protein BOTBODRAFT_51904 [Botryobasidium botryosum FD-172 SS1]
MPLANPYYQDLVDRGYPPLAGYLLKIRQTSKAILPTPTPEPTPQPAPTVVTTAPVVVPTTAPPAAPSPQPTTAAPPAPVTTNSPANPVQTTAAPAPAPATTAPAPAPTVVATSAPTVAVVPGTTTVAPVAPATTAAPITAAAAPHTTNKPGVVPPAASQSTSVLTQTVVNTLIPPLAGTATPTLQPASTGAPSSSGPTTGAIVGIVAAVLLGLAFLIGVGGYLWRRHTKRNEEWTRDSAIRNSFMLPDDAVGEPTMNSGAAQALARSNTYAPPSSRMAPSHSPRPPSMIERHVNHNGMMASFTPGMIVPNPVMQGNPAGYRPGAYTPPDEYHQGELTRQPSAGAYLARGPSPGAYVARGPSPGAYLAREPPTNAGPFAGGYPYEAGVSGDFTPYQQQQYAEITRQLSGPTQSELNRQPSSRAAPGPMGYGLETDGPFADQTSFGAGVQRALTVTYASLSSTQPTASEPTRTGTPSDPNPQQAFFPPAPTPVAAYLELSQAAATPQSANFVQGPEGGVAIAHQGQVGVVGMSRPGPPPGARNNLTVPPNEAQRGSVYEPEDAYGGI